MKRIIIGGAILVFVVLAAMNPEMLGRSLGASTAWIVNILFLGAPFWVLFMFGFLVYRILRRFGLVGSQQAEE